MSWVVCEIRTRDEQGVVLLEGPVSPHWCDPDWSNFAEWQREQKRARKGAA